MAAAGDNGIEFKNPNDWSCPNCGDHVFASRMACRRCATPRPAGLGDPVAAVKPPVTMRPGDWACPACGDHNYASRVMCRKCNTPKPADNGYGGYGYKPPSAPYASSAYGAYGQADPYAAYKPMDPAGDKPYGAPGMGPAGEIRPGDWNCPNCGEHCFASRAACRKCNTPKPNLGSGFGGGRPGDWACPTCGDLCYSFRTTCRKCNTPKPASAGSSGAGGPVASSVEHIPNSRPGDWLCPNCAILNYASRTECFKCGTAKA